MDDDDDAPAEAGVVAHAAHRPYFTREDIESKRVRREAALAGLSDLAPLLERFSSDLSRVCPECGDAKNNNRLCA